MKTTKILVGIVILFVFMFYTKTLLESNDENIDLLGNLYFAINNQRLCENTNSDCTIEVGESYKLYQTAINKGLLYK